MKKPEMYCSLCSKVAWYHVNRTGFCEEHRKEALIAQGAEKLKDDSRHAVMNFHAEATDYGRQR